VAVLSNRSSRPFPPAGAALDSGQNGTLEQAASQSACSPLRLHYLSSVSELNQHAGEMPLAEIHFGLQPTHASGPHPVASVGMEQLGGATRVEVWTSLLPVQYGDMNGIRYATNGEVLFGLVSESSIVAGAGFERRVHAIYRDLLSLIESQGCPHLLRMWNYFPGITVSHNDLENYHRFCRARSLAFQEHYDDFIHRLPSASAVGTEGDTFVLGFIAARAPGIHRENPRQMSAYSYPPQYGPRSPSFARATLTRFHEQEFFFISGTASIVGHESLHIGNVRMQIEETLSNIEALLQSTKRDESTKFSGLADLDHMKVYLRSAADLDVARELIHRRIGTGIDVLYLVGDICRRELLAEIEAAIHND